MSAATQVKVGLRAHVQRATEALKMLAIVMGEKRYIVVTMQDGVTRVIER